MVLVCIALVVCILVYERGRVVSDARYAHGGDEQAGGQIHPSSGMVRSFCTLPVFNVDFGAVGGAGGGVHRPHQHHGIHRGSRAVGI